MNQRVQRGRNLSASYEPEVTQRRWNAVADVLNALHGSLGWYID